ncbi:enterobactin exporter EntS [compost metagenome]
MLQAASLNGIVNQGSKIGGPLLGGLALSFLSPQWCIVLNACFRLSSYLLLWSVGKEAVNSVEEGEKTSKSAEKQKESLSIIWKEGWSFIIRSRLLLSSMIFGLIGALAIQMIDFQFTSLFRELAPDQESLLGWMVAASGAGAIIIILIINKMKREIRYGWRLGSGYALIGVSIGGLGLLPQDGSVLAVLILGFVLGIGNGIYMVTFNYCLQKETPPDLIGRVFGIQSTILGVVMIVAPLLGGLTVQAVGPARTFLSFGLVILVIGLIGILFGKLLWPASKTRNGDSASGQVKELV